MKAETEVDAHGTMTYVIKCQACGLKWEGVFPLHQREPIRHSHLCIPQAP